MPNNEIISDVTSEAIVIATLLRHPEFIYYSEDLDPKHFTQRDNQALYYCINRLVIRFNIFEMDLLNISKCFLDNKEKLNGYTLDDKLIQDTLNLAPEIARNTPEEYKVSVDRVMDCAFRREAIGELTECINICGDIDNSEDVQSLIYNRIDNVMLKYTANNKVPEYKDSIDDYWNQIVERQGDGYAGIPFKFPHINDYVTIERQELIIWIGGAKAGKSMMLLNCAVDLMRQGYSVLYIDSELNSRLFTARMLAHLSGVTFRDLTTGNYNEEQKQKIEESIKWLKQQNFNHIYMPIFDEKSIYTTVKKIKHRDGLDVLIIDYFKSSGEGDAYKNYDKLGKIVDMVKNDICGAMNIAGLGAAQATATGKIADSAKIARNASTIISITDKTPEEIEQDGEQCGNRKARIIANRNGMQMIDGEYIDLQFDGNHIMYYEAEQHMPTQPY